MRTLLLLLMTVISVCAQPVLRNTFTTNSPGKFPTLLPAPANTDNAKIVLHVDGKGDILQSSEEVYSNGVWLGPLSQAWTNDSGVIRPAGDDPTTNTAKFAYSTGSSLISGTQIGFDIRNYNTFLGGGERYFGPTASIGILGQNQGSQLGLLTNGLAIGVVGKASSENSVDVGVYAEAYPNLSGQTNVGLLALSIHGPNTGDSGNTPVGAHIGTLDDDVTTKPLFQNSILTLDSQLADAPLLLGRTNNGAVVFTLASTGLVTAKGFADNSGTVGTVVAYGAGGRLISTNIDIVVSNTVFNTVNTTTIKVNGNANLNQIILTNGVFSKTNTWSGATNSVDMSIYEQVFTTVTPCNFSGFINYSNSMASQVFLQILNNSPTNVTVTWPAALVMNVSGSLASSATITNGTVGCFWLHYTPFPGGTGRTNGVFSQL